MASDMGTPSSLSTGSSVLSEKVKRALEVRTDTAAMKAALEALSHLPSESMDSRSVRVAIEQDALQQALLLQEELQSLVKVVSDLRQGVSDTARIAQTVNEAIQTNVVQTRSAADVTMPDDPSMPKMPDVLPLNAEDAFGKEEQLAGLLADAFQERKDATQRAETVAAFLDKFDLSEKDSLLLESYNFEDMEEELNDGMAFLDALERVKSIRTELTSAFGASDLLDSSSTSQTDKLGTTSAIRMMESLSVKQERAYERLYHWLQKYLHLNSVTHVPTSSSGVTQIQPQTELDSDILDEALSHPFVKRSLQVLHHVPAFYSHTLELIASSRRGEETRRFLLALTSGYNGRTPIEMKAHDPINYVGDMLAFCFQSCSVEAEVAKGLVVEVSGEDNEEDAAAVSDEPTMSAMDMLSHAMSGLARPLKSRVLQVVASLARRPDEEDEDDDGPLASDEEEEDAIARSRISNLYSICGLLLFYRSAIDKAVRKLERGSQAMMKENPLVTAIVDCLTEASEAYMASLKVYAVMLESLSLMSGSSEAQLVQKLLETISQNRLASPGFTNDVFCPPQYATPLGMEVVAETLLDATLPLAKSLDDAVALKMSLANTKKAGLSTTVASQLDAKISQTEQALIQDLVKTETQEVLEVCGLSVLVKAWKNMPPVDGMVMASQPGLNPDDLESSLKEFYASLYSPPIPAFENTIRDPVLRKLARNKIASNVVNAYEELYEAIVSERGGYDDVSFLAHTPDQVKTLFSV